jgi:hypothetical protein
MIPLLDEKKAAKFLTDAGLKTSAITLQMWRWHRKGPPYLKVGGRVRYRELDLVQYIDNCVVNPTAGAAE